MTDDRVRLAEHERAKMLRAIMLVEASLARYHTFDPTRDYTPVELEPYDALADRYMRAVECCLKFFRSYERLLFAEYSETLRDLLNRMHKLGVISTVQRWMEMRDLRNRIVHDYLPEQIAALFQQITREFAGELIAVKEKAIATNLASGY